MTTITVPAQADTSKPVTRAAPSKRPRLVTSGAAPVSRPGAVILDDAVSYLTHYVRFSSDHEARAIVLNAARDHVFQQSANSQLYPALTSVVPESGKSLTQEITANLLPAGRRLWVASTAAPVYEIIESEHPSIMFDRIGSMIRPGSMVGDLLDAIDRRGGRKVPRQRKREDGNYTAEFDLFTPVWLSGIGLPETLAADLLSRCLIIELRPERIPFEMTYAESRKARRHGEKLRDELAAWLKPHGARLAAARPQMPQRLSHASRARNGLLVPLGIAELAGSDWARAGREAFEALIVPRLASTLDDGRMLLRDAAAVSAGKERISTGQLVAALISLDNAPWSERWDFRYSVNGSPRGVEMELARLLKRFGIESRQMKADTQKIRGYMTAELADMWQRYQR